MAYKSSDFSIRIRENLKLRYFQPNFKKIAISRFPESTTWDITINYDINSGVL